MKKNILFTLVFTVIFCSISCTPGQKKNTEVKNNIRYVNIKRICDFLDQRSPEYSRIYHDIKRFQNELLQVPESSEAHAHLTLKLESLEKEMDNYKRKNYKLIENILEQISDKLELDFILQYSEHIVYARKKFDITDEVIREIVKLEQRQSIMNR